jgi:hypothetical protein
MNMLLLLHFKLTEAGFHKTASPPQLKKSVPTVPSWDDLVSSKSAPAVGQIPKSATSLSPTIRSSGSASSHPELARKLSPDSSKPVSELREAHLIQSRVPKSLQSFSQASTERTNDSQVSDNGEILHTHSQESKASGSNPGIFYSKSTASKSSPSKYSASAAHAKYSPPASRKAPTSSSVFDFDSNDDNALAQNSTYGKRAKLAVSVKPISAIDSSESEDNDEANDTQAQSLTDTQPETNCDSDDDDFVTTPWKSQATARTVAKQSSQGSHSAAHSQSPHVNTQTSHTSKASDAWLESLPDSLPSSLPVKSVEGGHAHHVALTSKSRTYDHDGALCFVVTYSRKNQQSVCAI